MLIIKSMLITIIVLILTIYILAELAYCKATNSKLLEILNTVCDYLVGLLIILIPIVMVIN